MTDTVTLTHPLGADFHTAMVATAPGEKLLIGRRPVRNWTRRTISSLFVRRKLHFFLGKSTKTAQPALHFSTQICIKSFVPDPTGGYSALPDLLDVFRGGLLLNGGEGNGRGGEGEEKRRGKEKMGEERGGFVLCRRKKKESRSLCTHQLGKWCTECSAPDTPRTNGLVQSWRPPASRTRRNQCEAAGALTCARRRSDVTRCNGIDDMSPCGPLCANITTQRNAVRE